MRAASWWPVAIVGVLGATVVANVFMLVAAGDPNGAAVEPDYYRRAVAWDSTLAQERRNQELGWRIEAAFGEAGAEGTPLSVRLADSAGAPVPGASVRVTAIHNLEAPRRVTAELPAISAGLHEGRLPLARPGLWELRFEVERGSERFTAALRRDVRAARGGLNGNTGALSLETRASPRSLRRALGGIAVPPRGRRSSAAPPAGRAPAARPAASGDP
jgi:nitrogen fixation protein FixH